MLRELLLECMPEVDEGASTQEIEDADNWNEESEEGQRNDIEKGELGTVKSRAVA